MERLITIELFGQSFTFKTEADNSRAKEVADSLVQAVIKVASQQSEGASEIKKLTTMILASLNIANENIELKTEQDEFMRTISGISAVLIKNLDVCILSSKDYLPG
ncbi:MAG: cell division protein ZapA [Desulfobacterales bacterium]|nr:cell division protein ZapA [Desulfobacterales bacterium]